MDLDKMFFKKWFWGLSFNSHFETGGVIMTHSAHFRLKMSWFS